MNRMEKEIFKELDKEYQAMEKKEYEIFKKFYRRHIDVNRQFNHLNPSDINNDYQDKLDIHQLIDQLIKKGKNQGYKISVTIE